MELGEFGTFLKKVIHPFVLLCFSKKFSLRQRNFTFIEIINSKWQGGTWVPKTLHDGFVATFKNGLLLNVRLQCFGFSMYITSGTGLDSLYPSLA